MDKELDQNTEDREQLKSIFLSDGPESRMRDFLSRRKISVGMVFKNTKGIIRTVLCIPVNIYPTGALLFGR